MKTAGCGEKAASGWKVTRAVAYYAYTDKNGKNQSGHYTVKNNSVIKEGTYNIELDLKNKKQNFERELNIGF